MTSPLSRLAGQPCANMKPVFKAARIGRDDVGARPTACSLTDCLPGFVCYDLGLEHNLAAISTARRGPSAGFGKAAPSPGRRRCDPRTSTRSAGSGYHLGHAQNLNVGKLGAPDRPGWTRRATTIAAPGSSSARSGIISSEPACLASRINPKRRSKQAADADIGVDNPSFSPPAKPDSRFGFTEPVGDLGKLPPDRHSHRCPRRWRATVHLEKPDWNGHQALLLPGRGWRRNLAVVRDLHPVRSFSSLSSMSRLPRSASCRLVA